ncbi:hypothetical protein RFI_18058, partial [Reticulomyxa filosa]
DYKIQVQALTRQINGLVDANTIYIIFIFFFGKEEGTKSIDADLGEKYFDMCPLRFISLYYIFQYIFPSLLPSVASTATVTISVLVVKKSLQEIINDSSLPSHMRQKLVLLLPLLLTSHDVTSLITPSLTSPMGQPEDDHHDSNELSVTRTNSSPPLLTNVDIDEDGDMNDDGVDNESLVDNEMSPEHEEADHALNKSTPLDANVFPSQREKKNLSDIGLSIRQDKQAVNHVDPSKRPKVKNTNSNNLVINSKAALTEEKNKKKNHCQYKSCVCNCIDDNTIQYIH